MASYAKYFRLYAKTIRYAKVDPEVALVLARKTAEGVCKYTLWRQKHEVADLMLEKLIDRMKAEQIASKRIVTAIRTIQNYGNYGVHDQDDETYEITEHDALPCIHALHSLMAWFRDDCLELDKGFLIPVVQLTISDNAARALDSKNICYLGQLARMKPLEFMKLAGFRQPIAKELRRLLEDHGLKVDMKIDAEMLSCLT